MVVHITKYSSMHLNITIAKNDIRARIMYTFRICIVPLK